MIAISLIYACLFLKRYLTVDLRKFREWIIRFDNFCRRTCEMIYGFSRQN